MPEFTLTFTNDQAQRLVPVVQKCAIEIERHPHVQYMLSDMGVDSVDDLTSRQQLQLVLRFWLVKKTKQYERELAERAAGAAAEDDVVNSFPLEVDP